MAYFEAIGGAAGDMILASLLDAGLSFESLGNELAKVPIGGYRLGYERVKKRDFAATQFLVELEAEHRHHHGADPLPTTGPSLDEIIALIAGSGPKESVKRLSCRIFEALARASAIAEGVSVEELRFDPIDFVDSVVDVVGVSVGLDLLGVEKVYCSPLPMFHGTIDTPHGALRLPARATLELAASVAAPVIRSSVRAVQVTPTGAAILTTLATFPAPLMAVERVGYGAGEADLAVPNVVRVSIGSAEAGGGEERSDCD